ncbi:hypothetical protein AVEN_43812-1 [Araneus ventricosus]|uniref:Uncharacterized protein n=1 Tax=Araneus ventricosus TaxID=182803 RepID=A0A4Y2LJG4_ARAVE|nr:hypothetical protein AVEN_43812-1 [Araneus ventricosus]
MLEFYSMQSTTEHRQKLSMILKGLFPLIGKKAKEIVQIAKAVDGKGFSGMGEVKELIENDPPEVTIEAVNYLDLDDSESSDCEERIAEKDAETIRFCIGDSLK